MISDSQTPKERERNSKKKEWREWARRTNKPSNHHPNPRRTGEIALSRSSRRDRATWSLSPLDRSCHPWPTHDRSLSFSISFSLSLNLRSFSLPPPSLSLTEFLSLTNDIVLIFVSLSLLIEIFYYKICLEAEKMTDKMWGTSRKIAFLECNQTLENIFQNNFHNAAKHLKIFLFPKNIFTWKYFTPNQMQRKIQADMELGGN